MATAPALQRAVQQGFCIHSEIHTNKSVLTAFHRHLVELSSSPKRPTCDGEVKFRENGRKGGALRQLHRRQQVQRTRSLNNNPHPAGLCPSLPKGAINTSSHHPVQDIGAYRPRKPPAPPEQADPGLREDLERPAAVRSWNFLAVLEYRYPVVYLQYTIGIQDSIPGV